MCHLSNLDNAGHVRVRSKEKAVMSAADESKAAGNAAFAAGDYDKAVEMFTRAIEADPTNHVLYSNRSGAYAQKQDFKSALLDANKCIDLKGDWAKGHSRRGAAYFGLRNWPQAQTAYEKALELDPSSAAAKKSLDEVKLRRNPAAREAASAAAGNSAGTPASGTMLGTAASALSLAALVSGTLYMLPFFPRYALLLYKATILNVMVLFVLNLCSKFPLKFSTITDPTFKATQESQAFMLLVFMMVSPPVPFALMPFLSRALINVCNAYKEVGEKLPGPLGRIVGPRMAYFTTGEGQMQANAFGAVSEVIVTVMTPLLIVVQGLRAALLGFFYFQYVVRRYRTNQLTVQAVTLFLERTDGFFSHRFVPTPVNTLYRRFKTGISYIAEKFVN